MILPPTEHEVLQKVQELRLLQNEAQLRLKMRFGQSLLEALISMGLPESSVTDLMRHSGVVVEERPKFNLERTVEVVSDQLGNLAIIQTHDRKEALVSHNPLTEDHRAEAIRLQLPLWFVPSSLIMPALQTVYEMRLARFQNATLAQAGVQDAPDEQAPHTAEEPAKNRAAPQTTDSNQGQNAGTSAGHGHIKTAQQDHPLTPPPISPPPATPPKTSPPKTTPPPITSSPVASPAAAPPHVAWAAGAPPKAPPPPQEKRMNPEHPQLSERAIREALDVFPDAVSGPEQVSRALAKLYGTKGPSAAQMTLSQAAAHLGTGEAELGAALSEALGVQWKTGLRGEESWGPEWAAQLVLAQAGGVACSSLYSLGELLNTQPADKVQLTPERTMRSQVRRLFPELGAGSSRAAAGAPEHKEVTDTSAVDTSAVDTPAGQAEPTVAPKTTVTEMPAITPAEHAGSNDSPPLGSGVRRAGPAGAPMSDQTGGPQRPAQARPAAQAAPRGAVPRPQMARRERLGEILLDMGVIKAGQVELPEPELRKLVGEEPFFRAIARLSKRSFIDPEVDPPAEDAKRHVTASVIQQHRVFPHHIEERYLFVLMSDPRNNQTMRGLSNSIRGFTIVPVVATPTAINRLINTNVERFNAMQKLSEEQSQRRAVNEDTYVASQSDSGIVKVVDSILSDAIDDGASDIHFESKAKELQIKFRKDGKLKPIMSLPSENSRYVMARIKTMSQMDSSVNRKPLDGRMVFNHRGREFEFRVATIPVNVGRNSAEKTVLRLLASGSLPTMETLNLSDQNFKRLSGMCARPNGMLLITGPTGSGKSTSLAAILSRIATPDKNTMSIEDPVEYEIPQINQTQVNKAQGLDFARALRAFLRLDPDIIFVGEIRDHETAKIATEAALTGHLLISTIHSNDATGTVVRLTEMGIEPYNITGAMLGAMAQRLVRRLCPDCREKRPIHKSEAEKHGLDPEMIVWSPGEGECRTCKGLGYRGRLAIHEVLVLDDHLKQAISKGKHHSELLEIARQGGMLTMREDGLAKAEEGLTSIYEVLEATT